MASEITSDPKLSNDLEQAVQKHHGCLQLKGGQSSYVLLSMDVYRDLMGVGTDSELKASLAAIEEALADVRAGRTRSLDAFFEEIDARHGIRR